MLCSGSIHASHFACFPLMVAVIVVQETIERFCTYDNVCSGFMLHVSQRFPWIIASTIGGCEGLNYQHLWLNGFCVWVSEKLIPSINALMLHRPKTSLVWSSTNWVTSMRHLGSKQPNQWNLLRVFIHPSGREGISNFHLLGQNLGLTMFSLTLSVEEINV